MKIINWFRSFQKNRLALRLLISILIFSSILTIIITFIQLYLIYDRGIAVIHERLAQIEESYTKSIENSLWDLDDEQTENLLDGILRLPDISYVEIIDNSDKLIQSSGQKKDPDGITKTILLSYLDQKNRLTTLGSLRITASKASVYQHIKVQLFVILTSQAIKTFLVSIFILSIFHFLVTRHLSTIAHYTENIKQLQFNRPLKLKRNKNIHQKEDELDAIVLALNEMRDLAQLLPEMIFEIDLQGNVVFFNQMAHQMSGYNLNDFNSGLTIFDLIIPEQHELVQNNIQKIINGTSGEHHEYTLKRKSGGYFHVSASSCPIFRDGQCIGIRGILIDVTKRKKMESELKFTALHDELTGLPNRRLGMEHLSLAMLNANRKSSYVQIFFIDIDNFKTINDHYGHDVGDEVLKDVTQRMLRCIRKNDMLVRLGGDEFIIILADISDIQATDLVAQKLLESLAQPFHYKNEKLQTSASIGISTYPTDSQTPEKLIILADQAMYSAKKMGKNRFLHFSEPSSIE